MQRASGRKEYLESVCEVPGYIAVRCRTGIVQLELLMSMSIAIKPPSLVCFMGLGSSFEGARQRKKEASSHFLRKEEESLPPNGYVSKRCPVRQGFVTIGL